MNFSCFEMAPGYSKEDLQYIDRFKGSMDPYFGIGLQARYRNDWVATATLSEAHLGGGYTTAYNSSVSSAITHNFHFILKRKL